METLRDRNEHNKLIIAGKVAGGAFAGAALFTLAAENVSAHEPSDTDAKTIDLDKGETVWGEAIEAGIPESRIPDLLSWYKTNIPNIPDFNSMPTGYVLPIPSHLLPGTAEDTIDLDKGETVWGEAIEAGIPESEIPALVTWLEDNVPNMPSFDAMPVGYVLPLPAHLTASSPAPVPAGPVEVTVEKGSTIIEELVELGVESPLTEVEEVLVANDLTVEEASAIPAGTEIIIPADVLPVVAVSQTAENVPATPTVPEPTPTEQPIAFEPSAPVVAIESAPSPTSVAIPTPEVAPETPPVSQVEVAAEAEIQKAPEVLAMEIIMSSLIANNGVLTPEASALAYRQVSLFPKHLSGDPEFPNPEEFVKMPAPSVDIPFVVHPGTCAEELYNRPSATLESLVGIAVNEWLLMLPENADKRGSISEKGDGASGDHKKHDTGQATDNRDRLIESGPQTIPDGFAFNTLSPNFDDEFTKQLLILRLLARAPDGGFLVDHIEFDDTNAGGILIDEVNGLLFGLGRQDSPVKRVKGHHEHIHVKTRLIGSENPNAEAAPNTTNSCGYEYLVLDPLVFEQVKQKRALYPVANQELIPEATEAEQLPVSSQYWTLAPNYKEIIAGSNMSDSRKEYLMMFTEIIMEKYAAGAKIPPRATIAMAMWEGGWGEGKGVIEGNNPFSHKVSGEWAEEHPDEVVWIMDDEYDDSGNKIPSAFRKYASIGDALDAHVSLIQNSRLGQYEDAEKCRMDDKTFLEGLIHELRPDCSIGKMKGEDGVMSYATGENYVEKLYDLAADSVISEIILINPDEQQRMLTQEWLDYHAA